MTAVLKAVRILLLLPFIIVIGVIVFVFFGIVILAHTPRTIWQKRRWRSKLRRDGRYENSAIRPESIESGTLIVDAPTVGWGITQCWWTPDDVAALSPEPIPTEEDRQRHLQTNPDRLELPFDRWVSTKYLDANAGTAVLIAYRRGDVIANEITRRCHVPVVRSWSGPVAQIPNANKDVG